MPLACAIAVCSGARLAPEMNSNGFRTDPASRTKSADASTHPERTGVTRLAKIRSFREATDRLVGTCLYLFYRVAAAAYDALVDRLVRRGPRERLAKCFQIICALPVRFSPAIRL